MDKTCVINPATGRAVKIDSRLGKKLNKDKKPTETKTIEIKEKPKRTKKEPTKVVKEPSNKDKEDAVKKLQAVLKRKTTPKPAPKPEPKPTSVTPAVSGGVKRKYDADYIKGYAKHISNKYPEEGLKKALDKAKNGDDVKEIYDNYTSGMNKSMITLGKIVDQELTKEEKLKLFKEDKLVSIMYYRFSNLRDVMQDYLFKFESPAE
jgi:hypothetical protein